MIPTYVEAGATGRKRRRTGGSNASTKTRYLHPTHRGTRRHCPTAARGANHAHSANTPSDAAGGSVGSPSLARCGPPHRGRCRRFRWATTLSLDGERVDTHALRLQRQRRHHFGGRRASLQHAECVAVPADRDAAAPGLWNARRRSGHRHALRQHRSGCRGLRCGDLQRGEHFWLRPDAGRDGEHRRRRRLGARPSNPHALRRG